MKIGTPWPGHLIAPALVLIALVAAHGVILYYVSAYSIGAAAVASGVVILIVLKHAGLIGALGAPRWRRLSRRRSE